MQLSRLETLTSPSIGKDESVVQISDIQSMSSESSPSTTDGDGLARITNSSRGLSIRSEADSKTASTNDVRTLNKSEIDQAALTLARAFENDEMAKYFTHTPDRLHNTPDEHWKVHLFIMKCIVRAHIIYGRVTVIGDNYDCVALW